MASHSPIVSDQAVLFSQAVVKMTTKTVNSGITRKQLVEISLDQDESVNVELCSVLLQTTLKKDLSDEDKQKLRKVVYTLRTRFKEKWTSARRIKERFFEDNVQWLDNEFTSIPNPNDKTNLKESFVKFHVPDFVQFFREMEERLRDGNQFPVVNAALGFHNNTILLNFPNSSLTQLQLQWLAIDEAAFHVQIIYNLTSNEILNYENGFQERVLKVIQKEGFSIWSSRILKHNNRDTHSSDGTLTLNELTAAIDHEVHRNVQDGRHLFRGLLTLLSTMKQSYTDVNQHLNFFCYGNNEFGVIPDLFDILSDTGAFLVMTDMKKLVLDVYEYTLNVFFHSDKFKVKESIAQRKTLWKKMVDRIQRKINFPFLNGIGWDYPAGPVVFKCDLPPKNFLGERGQWGRNFSTGISPHASPSVPYDPPAGPLKANGTVGYIDERTPELKAVGFENSFQGYIESELALNPTSSCRDTCPLFQRLTPLCHGIPQHCPFLRNSHCLPLAEPSSCMVRNGCRNYAMKCKKAAREVKMCKSADTSKLYDWISFNGKVIGRNIVGLKGELEEVEQEKLMCQGRNVTTAVERWEIENGVVLQTPRYCELCFCICMTPFDPADQHYFDISPLVSNIEEGMIVSAIRFVKDGKVIQIAIEEGKPLMQGLIAESTTQWITKSFPNTTSYSMTSQKVPLGMYGFMRINFDLIIGPAGTVVTGVRFIFNSADRSISLEIQTTPIVWPVENATAISLRSSDSKWISSLSSGNPREPLEFNDPGDPMSQTGPSMPDSVLNSYVEFTSSSYESDLGQTVVPLFDTQPVFYYKGRRWLRGIGIMHKGRPNSGGFIAPFIVPANTYKSVHYHPLPSNKTVHVV